MAPSKPPVPLLFFLDSTAIANGANVPPDRCRTTPMILSEFQPGGATSRRMDQLLAGGMLVVEPDAKATQTARDAARAGGLDARLSNADLEVAAAALASGAGACLLTDDYTLQDLAQRIGVRVEGVSAPGIAASRDWQLACRGCGRRYATDFKADVCPVCGSELRAKPRPQKGSKGR